MTSEAEIRRVRDDSGNNPCYVAKGLCGHYYWCAVDLPEQKKETAKDIAKIIRRGDVVERKTVQWVRDGGLDWDQDCREGKCGERAAAAERLRATQGAQGRADKFDWDEWTVEYCGQSDPKIPNQHCQREKGHDGEHQSFSRKWSEA